MAPFLFYNRYKGERPIHCFLYWLEGAIYTLEILIF